jgi:integrase
VVRKFTQASLNSALRRGVDGALTPGRHADHEVRGLALVVGRRSARWVYSYKPHGVNSETKARWPTRDLTLGVPARISLPEARAAALDAKARVSRGEDPHSARMLQVEQTVAARGAGTVTVAAALDRYETALLSDPTPYKRTEVSQARKAADAVLELKGGTGANKASIGALDLPALKRWSRTLPERDATARLRWGALSRFLEWCVDEEIIETNPSALVPKSRKPAAPEPRDNIADLADIAAVWHATDNEPNPALADLVRFLCLVPCRRREAARMEFEDVDFQRREWRAPGNKTKNGKVHTLPLPGAILEIIERRKAAAVAAINCDKPVEAKADTEGLVFSGPKEGRVFSGWSRLLERLRKATGVEAFGFHAVRRGFVTTLGNHGFDADLLDGMLNHSASETRSGVRGVYNRSERLQERNRAMIAWSELVMAAVHGHSAKFIELKKRDAMGVVRLHSEAQAS